MKNLCSANTAKNQGGQNKLVSNFLSSVYLSKHSNTLRTQIVEFISKDSAKVIQLVDEQIKQFEQISNEKDYYRCAFFLKVLQDNIELFKGFDSLYGAWVFTLIDYLEKAEKYKNTAQAIVVDPNLPLVKYADLGPSIPKFRTETKLVSGKQITFDYLFDYRSTYSNDILTDSVFEKVQSFVFDFKNGKHSPILPIILAYHIYVKYGALLKQGNVCLCIIPSSTAQRSQDRFRPLTREISKLLGIEDGYGYITRKVDRSDSREQTKSKIDVLQGVEFSKDLAGKQVILLDDVLTMGTSVLRFNEHLKQEGVKSVHNIVLAKTYYHKGNNLSMPQLIELNKGIFNLL
ncbi:phosphoribosyltransferase [Myroides odoratus]|uniref:Phosphoribosyl transferase domain n=1 Tax=Myroides odoratus TaxID=256 RepID=A0A378RL01_MYROD|nr:phosphoribosyltransferase [Myroides odoratus]QQU02133.1 phosphoribosyltransferase [Myroides odoratus]STZ26961.1 Phosphoribosyl transferase domain [Myroides odoratus]